MVSVAPGTVATLTPFVNVNSTDDAVLLAIVLLAITTTTVVALAYVHDVAEIPPLGVAPTFAVHLQHESTPTPVTHATQHVEKTIDGSVATESERRKQ